MFAWLSPLVRLIALSVFCACGCARGSIATTRADERPDPCIAVLADPHVDGDPEGSYNEVNPTPALREVVRQVQALSPAPSEVVVLGDLARNAKEEDYRQYAKIISKLKTPVRHMLGNHDAYAPFRTVVLGDREGPAPGGWPPPTYCQTFDAGPRWRIITLDTRRTGQVIGEVGPAQTKWLEAELAAAGGRHVLIMMHHHPTDATEDGIVRREEFQQLIRRHPNVRAIVSAHRHIMDFQQLGPVHLVSAPPVAWTFRPDQPRGLLVIQLRPDALDVRFLPLTGTTGKPLERRLSWPKS